MQEYSIYPEERDSFKANKEIELKDKRDQLDNHDSLHNKEINPDKFNKDKINTTK